MALDVLLEFVVTVVGEVSIWAVRTSRSEAATDRWLAALPDAHRQAVLEIIACAVLADGTVSEADQRWIALREKGNPAHGAEMIRAIEAMRAALAAGGDGARDAALVAERAARFQDLDDLAKIDLQVTALLRSAGQLDALARLRAALNLPEDRRLANDATLASLMK